MVGSACAKGRGWVRLGLPWNQAARETPPMDTYEDHMAVVEAARKELARSADSIQPTHPTGRREGDANTLVYTVAKPMEQARNGDHAVKSSQQGLYNAVVMFAQEASGPVRDEDVSVMRARSNGEEALRAYEGAVRSYFDK